MNTKELQEFFNVFSAAFLMLCLVVLLSWLVVMLVEKIQNKKKIPWVPLKLGTGGEKECSPLEQNSIAKLFSENNLTHLDIMVSKKYPTKWITGRIDDTPFEFQVEEIKDTVLIQHFGIQSSYKKYKVLIPSGELLEELTKVFRKVALLASEQLNNLPFSSKLKY